MTPIEEKVSQIVKFVEAMYKPYKTRVVDVEIGRRTVYTIGFYFKKIPDDYISSDSPVNIKKNKEYNLTNEIRTYLENYIGIKTTGYQPNKSFYHTPEDHGITIVTQSDK